MENLNVRNNQTSIVSTIGYMIGIKRDYLTSIYEPDNQGFIEKLDDDSNARIIRSLCKIRTKLMANFLKVDKAIVYELKNLNTIDDYFKKDLEILKNNGINLLKANYRVNKYIIDINELIQNYINNCKDLFPEWVEWKFIKNIFIMPNGSKEESIKKECLLFTASRCKYPYGMYINWRPEDKGNILIADKKFIRIIYEQNGMTFDDHSKVLDANDNVKTNIYDFIDRSNSTVIVVDCENSDPYKLYAVLKNLNSDELNKVKKIILYDDIHTSRAWKSIEKFTDIEVEYHLVARIKLNKSLVDVKMCAGISENYYKYGVDSFILVSSDSDYWGIISSLPNVNFLVMIEYKKCGQDIKNALDSNGTYYCSIDDFCSGNINDFKNEVLKSALYERIDNLIDLNAKDLLEELYTTSRLEASNTEKSRFYEKYIKSLQLKIDENGRFYISN